MKIVFDFLLKNVKIKTSHLWMIGLGTVICLGFLVNCAIAPFMPTCNPIDNDQLIWSALIIAGLASLRENVLMRFKYLQDLKPLTKKEKSSAEEILKERIWVPCVGWCLVIGYAINMVVLPFFHELRLVDWNFLHTSTSLFLLLSGAREAGIYWQQSEKRSSVNEKQQKE